MFGVRPLTEQMSSDHTECMSIMIFNVNIYRTWKKNRILKIKWNKYNIIQFPQCLFEEISMEMFFLFFYLYILIQPLWFDGVRPVPPREIPTAPPHALHLHHLYHIYIYIYIFIYIFCKLGFLLSLPHGFSSSSVHLQLILPLLIHC